MFYIYFIVTAFILQAAGNDGPTDEVSITKNEGESVILNTDVKLSPRDRFTCFFNDVRIAQIIGNISRCTDVQCKDGDERFRDRLKLDHQTGSLTITNIRTTDAGLYQLQINSHNSPMKFYIKVNEVGRSVTVLEGDSVALHTCIETKQQDRITWFFNNTRIAHITGRQKRICTDLCPERFRDRLKLDDQTGSLTIANTSTSDSGEYKLHINSNTPTVFSVTIQDVPASQKHEMKSKSFKEGESLPLNSDELKNTSYLIKLYFTNICIVAIRDDHSKARPNDQCHDADGRFRDRLTVDQQTGSVTITNTRTTDSGLYRLEIIHRISSRFTIARTKWFSVTVTGSCLSPGAIAGICCAILVLTVLVAAAGVIYCRKCQTSSRGERTGQNHNHVKYTAGHQTESLSSTACNVITTGDPDSKTSE